MTTTTAPKRGRAGQRDPMRFHLHYARISWQEQGQRRGVSVRRRQQLHGAGLGGCRERDGDRRVPDRQLHGHSGLGAGQPCHDVPGHSWHGLLNGKGFDPAPFILLNLLFSAVAFYTGALVIIAQKAQTRTDKANEEASAQHREELGQYQTELLQRNTDITEQIHALAEKISALTEQVHAATCGRSPSPS